MVITVLPILCVKSSALIERVLLYTYIIIVDMGSSDDDEEAVKTQNDSTMAQNKNENSPKSPGC